MAGRAGKEGAPLAALAGAATAFRGGSTLDRLRRIIATLRRRRCSALSTPPSSESVSLAVDVSELLDHNWSKRFFRAMGLHLRVGFCEGVVDTAATAGAAVRRSASPSSEEDSSMKTGVLGRVGTAGMTELTTMQSELSDSVSTKLTVALWCRPLGPG